MRANLRTGIVVALIALVAGFIGAIALAKRRHVPESLARSIRTAAPRESDRSSELRSLAEARAVSRTRKLLPPASSFAIAKDEVRERDGAFGYRASQYLLTADREGITTALPVRPRNGRRPTLFLAFDEISIGTDVFIKREPAYPELDREKRTISYRRGTVEERYRLGAHQFEQDFVLTQLPAVRDDLVVKMRVKTNLTSPAPGYRGRDLTFKGEDEQQAISISKAVAIDAVGRSTPLELGYSEGLVSILVPGTWLQGAQLPITIDPLIGSPVVVRDVYFAAGLDIDFNAVTGRYLAAWSEDFGATSFDVVVQELDAAGAPIGSSSILGTDGSWGVQSRELGPVLRYAPSLNRYLIAWQGLPFNGNNSLVFGRILDGNGVPMGAQFIISPGTGYALEPSIAFNGVDRWLVAFVKDLSINDFSAAISSVSSSGVVTALTPPGSTGRVFMPKLGHHNNVFLYTWLEYTSATGLVSHRGRLLDSTGGYLTPITVLGPDSDSSLVVETAIEGAAGRFLTVWPDAASRNLRGRVIDASPGSSMNFLTPTFEITNPVPGGSSSDFPRNTDIIFSPTANTWFVVDGEPFSSPTESRYTLRVSGIDLNGALVFQENIAENPPGIFAPKFARNSTTDETLIAYLKRTPSLTNSDLTTQKYVPPSVGGGLAGRWKFDEGTGTLAADSSGAGNDGTLVNGVTWTTGKSGSAIQLNGSSQYVSVPAAGMPAANGVQTISWWMNYLAVPVGNECVVGLTNDTVGSAVQCGFRNGQVSVWKYGGAVLVQGPAPSPGAWHHVAYNFDGITHRLYINGEFVHSSTISPQTSVPDKVEFGRWSGGSEYFAGKLDEVAIYDAMLSATQIASLAALDPSVQAYFKFNEGTGALAADSSGNGHDGTLNAGVTWTQGRSGAAASFDGSSGNVSCVLGTGLPANNAAQSISWWMNTPSAGGVQAAIGLTNPGAGSAIQAGFRNGQVTVWNWGGNTLVSAPSPSLNAWHHFVYSFDGTTHQLFVDGVLSNTSTVAAQTAAPSRFDLGFTPGWGEYFTGKLDEVRIYDRVLTAAEVTAQAQVYSLEAYFKFDESVGPQTVDGTGNGHDAVLNAASWVAGRSGAGIFLNGTTDYMTATVANGLPANNAKQTISWWMNVAANPADVQTVFDLHNDGAASSVQGGFRNGKVTIWNHGGNVLAEATPPVAGSWHHYAYSYDGTTHRLYVDGVEAGTSTAAPQTADVTSFVFGRWNGGPAEYFTGTLDEFRIYNRTLSTAEIAVLAQDPSLAAHIKFDEGTGFSAADSTGNGHDGTLSSSASWTTGVLQSGLVLDGVSQVACLVRSGLPANNAAQTVAWWMKVAANPSDIQTAFDLHNDLAASSVQGGFRNGNVTIWNHGGNVLAQAPPPSADAWHHYAYTWDGTTHRLYVDGVEAGTSTAAPQTAAVTSLVFGRWNGGPGEYFNGALDDVRIHTRVLSAVEIQALYQGSLPAAPVITSPTDGQTMTQSRPPITGTSSAPGLLITLLVDGSVRGTTTSGVGGAWLVYPTALSDGFHTLVARAGGSSDSAPVTIAVNAAGNTTLTVTSTTIQDGGYVNSAQPTYTATLFNSQGTGINSGSLAVRLDGNLVGNSTITVIDPNTVTISFIPSGSFTSQSSHTITIDGVNGIGGTLATTVAAFSVDLSAPVVSNIVPADGAILNTPRPAITATFTDTGGSGFDVSGIVLVFNSIVIPANQVEVTLSNNNNTATVAFTSQSDLADATHMFSVEGKDRALNASASATRTFTVDTGGPGIVIASPDGTALTTGSVALDATVSDSFTGVVPSSIQVTLNGAPVTATQVAGGATAFGTPASVHLTGTLQPLLESNLLVVSVSDLAGNSQSTSIAFLAPAPPTPGPVLAIEMISGDGQAAVTGQCVQNDLVVRVFDVNSGASVPGVAILFEEPSFRLGWPEPSPNGNVVTGTDGRAYAKWVLSPVPGANIVEARIHPENRSRSTSDDFSISATDRVSFTLHGHSPTLADVTVRGPNNICGFLTSEFPGSALSRLFKIQVKDHTGSPMKGVAVFPRISQFEDISPPSVNVGRFLPSQGVTDNEGCATFAFVISPDVLPSSVDGTKGGFTMEFSLPFFRDASGKAKTFTLDGKVLHPSTREFGSGEIDYGDPQPGQSQIGVPNRRLATTLKVKNTGRVRYLIIEGQGFFETGDHGIDEGAAGTECGQGRQVLLDNNKADIKFTMTGGTHALVAINGVTDVFAIGPPEVDFVRHSNPSLSAAAINGYGRPLALSGGAVSLQDAGFRIRVYLPTNFQGTVVGKLKSLDRCGNDLNILNPLGALKLENIPFAPVGGNDLFSIYEAVGDPFAAIETGIGDNTASLPAGARFLQLTGMGTIDGEVDITPEQDQGGPGPVIKERPAPRRNARLAQEVVYEVGDVAGIFATAETTTKPGDPGAVGLQFRRGYKWTFFRPGGTPDPPFYTDSPTLYFKVSETVHDVTPGKGTNAGNFITLQVPRGRRGIGAVRVEAVDTNENPWPNFKPEEAQWRVSCGPKVGPAIDLVTPDPTKPTQKIIDPAMFTVGPAATKFKAIVDANLLSALPIGPVPPDSEERSDMKIMTGTETPFTGARLTSIVQDYKNDARNEVFATTMAFYRPVNATTVTTAVYGTVFYTPFCFNELDKGDFESTLAHEVRHVEMLLAFKGANYPGKTAEHTAFASLEHDLFLEVYKAGAGLPAGGELKYRKAAGRIAISLEHLDIEFNTVKAFFAGDDTTSSNWYLRQSVLAFSREYMVLMNALKNGVPVTGAANVMIVTKSVRDRLIARLRTIHGEIPAEAAIMRRRHESEVPVNAPGATLFGPQLPLPKTE